MASMSNTEVPSDQTSLTLPMETEDKEGDHEVGTPPKLDEKVEQPEGDESKNYGPVPFIGRCRLVRVGVLPDRGSVPVHLGAFFGPLRDIQARSLQSGRAIAELKLGQILQIFPSQVHVSAFYRDL